jgi:hypothetical protein
VNKDLEAVLSECLNQMNKGESVEACVAQYPTLAAQLEPLLRLALQVKALRQEQAPPPVAMQAGRQRLLREAARLKSAQLDKAHTVPVPWWLNLQALMRRSMAAAVLASMLVIVALGAGTVAASARSLPGDALYPVKRVTEEFQLLLTFDQQSKARLVQKLDERRREEAKAIASSQRIAEMSFRGQVDSVDGSHWTIGGVLVRTSDETVIEEDVVVGALARVRIRSLSDGTLLAMRISVEPESVPLEPTASPTVTEPATMPTTAPTPTQLRATKVPVQPAAPTATPSPTLMASPTLTLTPSATPSATATALRATPSPPREVRIRFTGSIEALAEDVWTVGGQVVRIGANTRIDENAARAAVGAIARVLAVRREDGTLLAIEITVERAPQPPEQPFEFQGLIESFGPTQWVVSGHTLIINADTVIEGTPHKGLLAEVKALRQGDGSLRAVRIFVRLPSEEVEFEGVIQSLSAGEWIVEGVTVRLDAQTLVEGTPSVGASAEVQGLLLPDGAVLARRIMVQAPPTATPTPTIQPTATLTPTIHSTATLTPTTQPAVTPTTASTAGQTVAAPDVAQKPALRAVGLPLPATSISPGEDPIHSSEEKSYD